MPNRPAVTEAEMRRAIKAAAAEGQIVRECIIEPGKVRLIFIDADNDTPQPIGPKQWPKT